MTTYSRYFVDAHIELFDGAGPAIAMSVCAGTALDAEALVIREVDSRINALVPWNLRLEIAGIRAKAEKAAPGIIDAVARVGKPRPLDEVLRAWVRSQRKPQRRNQ